MADAKEINSDPRPLRVAYLIDQATCTHELLDALFAESFGRWGGRRTPIIPATTTAGIDPVYARWLELYDADIIYSYLDLTPTVIADIHEKYCPLYLKRHPNSPNRPENARSIWPDLPLTGLTAMSIMPMLRQRRMFTGTTDKTILDIEHPAQPSRLISDNFGSILGSYRTSQFQNFPDVYNLLCLSSPNRPERQSRLAHAEYVTDETEILRRIATSRELYTMSMLSDTLAPYLDTGHYINDNNFFNLVIGDSLEDRLLYWNCHQRFSDLMPDEIADFIITPQSLENTALITRLLEMVGKRCWRNNSNPIIRIRSQSLTDTAIEGAATRLRAFGGYISIQTQKIESASDYVTMPPGTQPPSFRSSASWGRTKIDVDGTYTGERAVVPVASPLHFKEVSMHPAFKTGAWMLDLSIERQNTHSRISNRPHYWLLPRRLRLDRFFKRETRATNSNLSFLTSRVNRFSLPSIPTRYDNEPIALTIPDDTQVLAAAATSSWEWHPFSGGENELLSRPRFIKYNTSDKARYLRGVLKHFKSLYEAEKIFLSKFWHEVFIALGASPKDPSSSGVSRVKKFLRAFVQSIGANGLNTDEGRERLAIASLRSASGTSKDQSHISWRELEEKWQEAYRVWNEQNPPHTDDDPISNYAPTLERSTQYLCQQKILFQGQSWQCTDCLNHNWVNISDLKPTLICEVCEHTEAAPIATDWKFFLNGFVQQAMKQHGITAVIWCLVKLNEMAEQSFYYAPSIEFYDDAILTNENANPVAEADLIAVINGKLYVCEVKSSDRDRDFSNFIKVIERLRPDVAMIAIMTPDQGGAAARLRNELQPRMPLGVEFEIMNFQLNDLDDSPSLPSGRSFLWAM